MHRRPRGSGSVIRGQASWAIRYGPRGRQAYESGFRTRAEAENRLTLLRAEAMQQRLGYAADPRLSPTLAQLAQPWLDRRKVSVANGAEDGYRWTKHLEPLLGHLRPDEVGTAQIRSLLEAKHGELKSGTLGTVIAVLSALYEDLLERGVARANPCRGLPQSVRKLARSDHDPRTTPFIEKLDDVRRVYLALREANEGIGVAYALGAFAGLRTGEVFFLRWPQVDLQARRIWVSESRKGPTKDREPRPVPILDPLLPVLQAWRLTHPGTGLVVPPLTSKGQAVDRRTPSRMLRTALKPLGLAREGLGWYEATRHTFASQWAMAGRSLRELQAILGHSSIAITERYAHLAKNYWTEGVHGALPVSLEAGSVAQFGTVSAAENPKTPTKSGASG